ncbi:MAG: DUF402 domain-containing protein [Ilumatobacteraceae bacterium]
MHIVEDDDDALVSYVGPGAEFGFVDGVWPTATGEHPWRNRTRWEGHGCLMVQRRDEMFAVWHYWRGLDRQFLCWYINFQAPFHRTAIGYDTQDFELDMVVFPDGRWVFKDRDVLADRVSEGQLSQPLVDEVVHLGDEIARELDAGQLRWDQRWADWRPPPAWRDADLPADWNRTPS